MRGSESIARMGVGEGIEDCFDDMELSRQIEIADRTVYDVKELIINHDGITCDSNTYSTLMHGKTIEEGLDEDDVQVTQLSLLIGRLELAYEGENISVISRESMLSGSTVGSLGSFAAETFQPVRFEIELLEDSMHSTQWLGRVMVGVKKVVQAKDSRVLKFKEDLSAVELTKSYARVDHWQDFSELVVGAPDPRPADIQIGNEVKKQQITALKEQTAWLLDKVAHDSGSVW